MSELLDVILAIANLIHEYPRAGAVCLVFGGAGAIFAVLIRLTRNTDSLSLR
jgi:hypothetical protein